jgi:DNA-binding response OmpR family regulator
VDDEPDVLSYIKDTLDAHGYKTLATDSPLYAQELFQKMPSSIDLVITDLLMPLMSGTELSKQLRSISSTVKVIGISGFSGGTFVHDARYLDALIKKPFDSAKLLWTIRSVLDVQQDDRLPGG